MKSQIRNIALIVASSAVALTMSGCSGMSTGTSADVESVETKNSLRADGYGHDGFTTYYCYAYAKLDSNDPKKARVKNTKKDNHFRLIYNAPFVFDLKGVKKARGKMVNVARVDYALYTGDTNDNHVQCYRKGLIPGLAMGDWQTGFITPDEVDAKINSQILKWTDYKNPFYKVNANADKVLVYTLITGDQLAYPFSTEKEKLVIEHKVFQYDKKAILSKISPFIGVVHTHESIFKKPVAGYEPVQVVNASTYSFNRQAQVNEILRTTGLKKPSVKTLASYKKDVALKYLAEIKQIKKVKNQKAEFEQRQKAIEIAEQKRQKEIRLKQKRLERKARNGQSIEI